MFTTYYENGLGIIPVRHGKNPAFNGWQIFCERLPTEKEIQLWQAEYDRKIFINIGLPCGEANNIIAVDIDDQDPEIAKLVPPSLVRKRGKKGETRFFQYHESLPAEKMHRFAAGVRHPNPSVEVLSTGNQTVMPPSIHPETGLAYYWITEDRFPEFEAKNLPIITNKDLEPVREYLTREMMGVEETKKLQIVHNDDPDRKSPHGAQDQLKIVAAALIGKSASLDEAVIELLKADEKYHPDGGYFSERGRTSDQRADRITNAAHFYISNLRSHNIKRLRSGLEPQAPLIKPIKTIDLERLAEISENEKEHLQRPYPEARGYMKDFQKCCKMMAHGDQEALSLGGAIALMGVITSNKFISKIGAHIVTPNVYVMNLGHSSFGKELAQRLAGDLLANSNLIGSSSYRSGTSIIQDLPKQQERLDIIDEASALLGAMSSDNIYQKEMMEIFSSVFSKACSKYHGAASSGKGARAGACWNPHISILASTTPAGFKESVKRGFQAKGLMPRFLTFIQKIRSDYRRITEEDARAIELLKASLHGFVNYFLETPKLRHPDFYPNPNILAADEGTRYLPNVIPFTPEAEQAYFEFDEIYYKKKKEDPEDFESAFYGRFAELALKLSLLDAVSLSQDSIGIHNFEWAKEVVETQWENSKALYRLTNAETVKESNQLRVLDIIRQGPGITSTGLIRKTQWLDKNQRNNILEELQQAEQIETFAIETGKTDGRKPTAYRAINSHKKFK